MPLTDDEEDLSYLHTDTADLKMVSDYTGMNFNEIIQLDCITFKMLFRDAFIHQMGETEEGREYLENCWIMTQTAPNKKKLREHFKGVE